jgi:uncharacterized protein YbjT (DUF2867 family)
MTASRPTELAITGSTGHLGGVVARALAQAGVTQRLVVRSAERAPRLEGSSVAEAAYGDSAAAVAALQGVSTLFMVSGSESEDRVDQHRAFIDSAVAAGVEHVVYTSFLGASPDSTFTLGRDHFATEEHLRSSGLKFTFLRDNFYLDFFAELAGADGVIRGPAADGRVSAVARSDIAAAAVSVLRNPAEHVGLSYDLTGREALTLAEVADIVSERTGRAVRFHNETLDEAYASRAVYSAPSWQVDAWVSTYTAFAAGEQQLITDDVLRLTGHEPITLAQYLQTR